MCWQQLPVLAMLGIPHTPLASLSPLYIPHTVIMLGMPLAWAVPSAPSVGLGTGS